MITLRERELCFQFPACANAVKFDCDEIRGGGGMKTVDIVFEHEGCTFYLEVKDPDDSNAPPAMREQFAADLQSGRLIQQLAGKFRDSHWFNLVRGAARAPIVYVVLLAMERADPVMLSSKRIELRAKLPARHDMWPSPCVDDCIILNMEQYRARFGKESVRRVSDGEEGATDLAPEHGAPPQ